MCLCAVIISYVSAVKIPKEIKNFFVCSLGSVVSEKEYYFYVLQYLSNCKCYLMMMLLLMRIIVANGVLWVMVCYGW